MRSGLFALATACAGAQSAPPTSTPPDVDTKEEMEQIGAIAAAMNRMSPAIHSCWARGASDDFHLNGRTVLRVEIGSNSLAREVAVVDDSTGDPILTECLRGIWTNVRWPSSFVAGDVIQLPPLEFVAPTRQYAVATDDVAERPWVSHSVVRGTAKLLLTEKNTGTESASLVLLETGADTAGDTIELHRHESTAEMLYVLEGQVSVYTVTPPRKTWVVGVGGAIYIAPGATYGLRAQAEPRVRLLQLFAPAGAEQRYVGTSIEDWQTPPWQKGTPAPVIASSEDAKTFSILDAAATVDILHDSESGTGVYVGVLRAQAGAKVPRHHHDKAAEVLFVLEGAAKMTIGSEELEIGPGDAVLVPPGAEHSAIALHPNLTAVQFYSPGGPEARFKVP